MKKLKKIFKKILDAAIFLLTFGGSISDGTIGEGIVDYSSQERDKHGR